MFDLIGEIFNSGTFIPHGHCYLWKPELVWLHILSDSTIALSYYSIPITLFHFVQRRKDLPFNWVFILFAAFITFCGTSHWMSVWTLWHPVYWLSGGIKAVTALISLSTAIVLFVLIPKALAIPSAAQLKKANLALKQEIAERKRVEAELLCSRDLREAIFNESTDALFLVDPQTLLTLDCNRCAVKLFQANDRTDLIGIAGHTLQRHPSSQDDLNAITAEMQLKGYWSREVEYLTHQGNFFWGNTAAKSVTVAGQTMNLVRVTDISDHKQIEADREQAEQALRMSEVRYRAIVEDQTELIVRFLPDCSIVFVNSAFCQYFELQPEEILGKRFAATIFKEDQALVIQWVKSMNANNPTVMFESRVVVNGEVRWTQWANHMLFDEQGQFVEVQSVGRDITERKQTDDRLQASLREKEVLFKEIHHRVKNNLQIVYSLLRLQRRQLKDQLAANALLESQSRIESIALIHEKLYQSEDLTQINLAEYIPSLIASLFSTYNVNSSQIILETQIEPILLDIDRAIRYGLIINELLSNALKYAFPLVDQSNSWISVELFKQPKDSAVVLSVKDNGVGLPGHINFSKPETLGLQLVHGFVGQMGGYLQMCCQNGTAFQMTFPQGVPE
ncbi:MAG: sensor histidine kinase [Leptolyngbya sp. BL-A-14]